MCDVLGVLGIFCGLMSLLYVNASAINVFFSEVMDLTVRGVVQGSFRATLGVASVFVLTTRAWSLGMFSPSPSFFFLRC